MKTHQMLSNGLKIPVLGLGTWKSESHLVGDAVKFAITKAGYRHIDCASIYGNQPQIGKTLKSILGQAVKREEVFITSKLWNTDHRPDNVEKACRKTLSDLQIEYLDLYLMHWGIAFKPGGDSEPVAKDGKVITDAVSIQETWQALESLVGLGLVKSIGVSNFTTPMLLDLLTYSKIKPATNQIEIHPYNTQTKLINFCKDKKISVTSYSPLGRQGVKTIQEVKLFDEKIIKKLSKKYQKTPAQILLNWAINRGTIAIPKSISSARIEENINIFDFEITAEETIEVDSLNRNLRIVNPEDWWGIPYFV